MTCIVAVSDGETVVIGGDSAGTAGQELRLRADPKVFQAGPYVIGFTTSFRMGQILQYAVDLPAPPRGETTSQLQAFLVSDLVPVLRHAYAEQGFIKSGRFSSDRDPKTTAEGQELGGLFLLGVAGQIFEIGMDFQVGRPFLPYSAVGSGALVALGALHAMELDSSLLLRERAERALAASESYCASVRGPFHFVEGK